MKLKNESQRTVLPCEILDADADDGGFVVEVRHVTRQRLNQLIRQCSRKEFNNATRAMEDNVDPQAFLSAVVKEYLAGWKGLTVDRLLRLAPLNEGEEFEVPDPDAAGYIPFDFNVAKYIWERTWPEDFANKVSAFSHAMAEVKAAADALKKSESANSSDEDSAPRATPKRAASATKAA